MARAAIGNQRGAAMNLAELERYFAAVATSTSGPPAGLAEVFKNSANLPASALLGIYNRGYHYRLLGALSSVFARTKLALGEPEFERLGLQYLAHHPSEHPAVERVGRVFPEYLAELGGLSPELPDLARLEWARLCALVAADPSDVVLASAIDAATFPSSRLRFVASLGVISIDARALASFRGASGAATERSSDAAATHVGVAVWRRRYAVQHQALASVEFEALQLARAGASVSHFCAVFESGSEVDDAAAAFRVVATWFAREWIDKIE
jgi:hypothetical protein